MSIANGQNEILRIFFSERVSGTKNQFSYTKEQINKHKISITESELVRIIKHITPENNNTDGSDCPFIKDLLEMQVTHSKLYLDELAPLAGVVSVNGKDYKRLICSAGHARSEKAFFVSADIWEQLNEIMLCGIDPTKMFSPSKVNAYMGLVASSSTPVTMPRVVVIPDYKKPVHGIYDVVRGNVATRKYHVERDIETDVDISPFDGAGLVFTKRARNWRQELGLNYIPSAFQFRCIPGIKGVLFTFDTQDFAKECGSSKIVDYWGRTWDIWEDDIDVILTKSQFKFAECFESFEAWSTEFAKEPYGYRRTWNISYFSEAPENLENQKHLAYQQLQTLHLTHKEIKTLAAPTISKIKKLHSDPKAFLDYRGVDEYDDDGIKNEDWNRIPAYFRAMCSMPDLFNDSFVRSEVKKTVARIKKRAYAGRLLVKGNYQILAPDIFGLAQYAFGLEVTGLLGANQIYSQYWNDKNVSEIDMMRNPHIANEHNIMDVTATEDMRRWYQYQEATIITGMYDTAVLKCNGADFDGDKVLTSSNKTLISAVKRQPSNTIVPMLDSQEQGGIKCAIGNIDGLMKADNMGFQCNIGNVINPITTLWALPQTDQTQDYIRIMSVVGSLTIDAAKSGQAAKVPTEISRSLKSIDPPYFMRYREQTKNRVGTDLGKYKGEQRSTMNRICHYMEQELKGLKVGTADKEFDFSKLMSANVRPYGEVYQQMKQELISLQEDYEIISNAYGKSKKKNLFQRKYDCFFSHCRTSLLCICPDINKALDYLIFLYYTDKEIMLKYHNKSIMWNAFGTQMVRRAKGDFKASPVDSEACQKRRLKSAATVDEIKADIKAYAEKLNQPIEVYRNDVEQIAAHVSDFNQGRLAGLVSILGRKEQLTIQEHGHSGISPNKMCDWSGVDRRMYIKAMEKLKHANVLDMQPGEVKNSYNINFLLSPAQIDNGNKIATVKTMADVRRILKKHFPKGEKN